MVLRVTEFSERDKLQQRHGRKREQILNGKAFCREQKSTRKRKMRWRRAGRAARRKKHKMPKHHTWELWEHAVCPAEAGEPCDGSSLHISQQQ